MRIAITAATLLAVLLMAPPVFASAVVVTLPVHNYVISFPTSYNNCLGLYITSTETDNGVFQFVSTPSGVWITHTTLSAFTYGVASNGVVYTGHNAYATTTVNGKPSDFTVTLTVMYSGTDGTSYQMKWAHHFTVTPDGTLVVDNSSYTESCS